MNAVTPRRRIAVWVSAGAASAVAAKLTLANYPLDDIAFVRCIVKNEHPDNDRFVADLEAWLDRPVINIASTDYADCWEVWEKRRYLAGHQGAPCTLEMKKAPRQIFERDWDPRLQVFGFTVEERERARKFAANNPEVRMANVLIDASLSKADCMGMLDRAGIRLPVMYGLGFNNNNCRGCVKAAGRGYWSLVRQEFPAEFVRMAALSRDIGWTPCKTGKGEPVWLDELDPAYPPQDDSPAIECSVMCHIEISKMEDAQAW